MQPINQSTKQIDKQATNHASKQADVQTINRRTTNDSRIIETCSEKPTDRNLI